MDKIYRARRRRARQLSALRGRTFRQRMMALATVMMFAGVLAVAAVGVVSVMIYRSYANDLVHPEQAIASQSVGQSIAYDRNGQKLHEYVDPLGRLRDPVPLTEISPYLIAATVATEDASFYDNPGVNFRGLARAAFENLTPFGPGFFEGSGGSSITQQLVKNVYLTPEEASTRGVDGANRKIKETVIALELKQEYDDNQILEWYLNQIAYGGIVYGAEEAAQTYFGKSAKDLTLSEAALLAGVPQSPSYYNPGDFDGDPATVDPRDNAKARQLQVLDLMVDHYDEIMKIRNPADGSHPWLTLTLEEIEAARHVGLNYIENSFDIQAPHFVYYIEDQVTKMCAAGLFPAPGGISCDKVVRGGGLRIVTTLDLGLNALGQQIVEQEIAKAEGRTNGHNASLVAIKPETGEILAYVGSRGFGREDIDGDVDIASSLQSHGSTMKMFTYLKAFEDGWVPSTYVEDKPLFLPTAQGQKQINNWNMSHTGTITLRKGFSESINTTAVRTLMDVGEDRFRELAHRIGITDLRQGDCGATITLGACEVKLVDQTFAFAVLANNGMMRGRPTSEDLPTGFRELDQVAVLKITDSEGRLLYEFKGPEERQVVDPAYAYMVTDVLSKEAINWSRLTIDRPATVKTGTSEDFRDNVVMGYTPNLTAGVWMGNADNTPMASGTFSSQGVGPIWQRFMREAHAYLNIPKTEFVIPENVAFLSCSGKREVFKKDTPTVKSGACRGPSGVPGGPTASPTPRGPVFPPLTEAPTPAPETPVPTPVPEVTPPGPEPTRPALTFYTTQEGDTVTGVATLFGIDPQALANANGITVDTVLVAGTVLVIPG
jgi:membrane peptidoglycan carboxypeptidase